jgi:hypothetical protein
MVVEEFRDVFERVPNASASRKKVIVAAMTNESRIAKAKQMHGELEIWDVLKMEIRSSRRKKRREPQNIRQSF